MKTFFLKITTHLLLPFFIFSIFIIIWDPFKVFFQYPEYYKNNNITLNRENVCLSLYKKHPNNKNLSNFIIGNSRSNAFKTKYWSYKINMPNQTCFHYDGSSFGLYRTINAIKFLKKQTNKIDNILLITDLEFYNEIENPTKYLYTQPAVVSKQSAFTFYLTFLKAATDIRFLFYNIVYKFTRTYFGIMDGFLSPDPNFLISDNLTADLWYFGYDKQILEDSLSYYKNLVAKNIFYNRDSFQTVSNTVMKQKQIEMLSDLNSLIKENNINLKIIISPLYNQIKFNPTDLKNLKNIFGDTNVFDFSGKNEMTQKISNYYESSHYKSSVANHLLDIVYNK